jgi:D-sedoheptulose 7-phosphate isomerase
MIDINEKIDEHLDTIQAIRPLAPDLAELGRRATECLANNGKILWMGNGGSAADSQHLAAELVGRFSRERQGLASVALTTDSSILTALGNDYGFDNIFARQIEALCNPGDIVIGISTSGNSANVLRAVEAANACDAMTVGFAGHDGGALKSATDLCLVVPSGVTARIQEGHILIGHLLCDWIEDAFVNG